MHLKGMILQLENFWRSKGVDVFWPYDVEKGAATANPLTFLRVLEERELRVAYIEPCRRPQDGRYGENSNRLYQHHQFQVLMKPAPNDIEELYLSSLESIGLDLQKNDIRFLEDNWKQPTLGAWGLGAEVRANGMEVTQFTYFSQVGNIDLATKPIEIAYGVERLALVLQDKEDILDLQWDDNNLYRDIFQRREYEFSKYTFEVANSDNYFNLFNIYIDEAARALAENLPLAAYDMVLKASHAFNILDAKGVISARERQNYILKVSKSAKECCQKFLKGTL